MFKSFKQEKDSDTNTNKAGDNELPWLQTLDEVESMELWDKKNREDRSPWQQYLQQADELLKKPRKSIPKAVVGAILAGDMGQVDVSSVPSAQPKVVVFVSSTFTDTKAERNQLMKDVYPFLRSVCRRLGLEFGTVDMRWGVTDEASSDHSTVSMCVNEIKRCIRGSVGPAFLCLLGHKYGYRCMPAQIEKSEFESMLAQLQKASKDTTLMQSYYTLDNNAIPPEYVLKPKEKSNKTWWDDQSVIQNHMREASVACFGVDNPISEKYHISVTETEIQHGVFNNSRRSNQSSFVRRDLKQYDTATNLNRKLTDLVDGKVDKYAKKMITELKSKKISEKAPNTPTFDVMYGYSAPKQIANDIRNVCDKICENLVKAVLKSYEENLHVEDDRVFQEAVQHRTLALDKGSLFVGRDEELKRISDYVHSNSKQPLVVHGQSGCGKTALMAVATKRVKDALTQGIIVLRFLGTTGQSASARLLLHNVCEQITRVYDEDAIKIPTSYKDLIAYFRTCLAFATSDKPLVLFLDSLDQLSNEDFGLNLAWLSLAEDLPDNVKVIVSSLPIKTLEILKANIKDANQFIEVKALTLSEGPEIMSKMLQAHHRKVTEEQKAIILKAFKKCPLPLFLRLVVDLALKWHSYDKVDPNDIADDMPGLISRLFDRLESHFGQMFVHHALAYITCSKNGLSLAELEDILSCDDEVLDNIFQWWVPPIRRIPPLLWARVRNELGSYLTERGTDGVSAYGWYHRQFWETAEKRYLDNPFKSEKTAFRQQAHVAIADYFDGKWEVGKPHERKKDKQMVLENRKVPKQPLVFSGERGGKRQLNERKMTELPYHLIHLCDWGRFKKLVLDLSYIEAKFEADDGYNCLSELIEATKLSGIDEIKQTTRFVGASLGYLVREPNSIYQLSLQQTKGSYMRGLIDGLGQGECPLALMRNMEEQAIADPCEMSLQGHSATLRCCHYSPAGDLIVSSADDSTMRIWDTTTGAELVTITSLPAPIFPDKKVSSGLMMHPVNPCCFSRTGEIIASGTELGGVMLWDKTGVQLHSAKTNNQAVTYITVSPDNKHVACTFNNGVLGVWSAKDLTQLAMVNISQVTTTCCIYSDDGTRLAVTMLPGVVMFDVKAGYKILSSNRSECYQNICCAFTPGAGDYLMSGGDDSCVSVFDGRTGKYIKRMRQHNAWIWSLEFTKDGQFMFTGSSDRTMKVWKRGSGPLDWSVIATVGGHSHRVSMLSIERGTETKIVTSSLDRTLKVWDLTALTRGEVPPVGGGHYNVVATSSDAEYMVTSQGWFCGCKLFKRVGGELNYVGDSKVHPGFIRDARITPDDSKLFTLDHGHKGTYEHEAAKNAKVIVMGFPSLNVIEELESFAPTAIAVCNEFAVVGSLDGKVHVNNLEKEVTWKCPLGDVQIHTVAVTLDGKKIAVGCTKYCFLLSYGNSTFKVLKEIPGITVGCTSFSRDGRFFVCGTESGLIHIYDVTKADVPLVTVKKEHSSYFHVIKFSTSGNFMLSSDPLSLRVWDVKSGFKLRCTYYAPVNSAAFVDDTSLMAGEATGNLKQLAF